MNIPTPLIPGDVFEKRWGNRRLIIVMLPSKPFAKQRYRKLHRPGVSIETAHWSSHEQVTRYGLTRKNPYRFIGNIPDADFLEELSKGTECQENLLIP